MYFTKKCLVNLDSWSDNQVLIVPIKLGSQLPLSTTCMTNIHHNIVASSPHHFLPCSWGYTTTLIITNRGLLQQTTRFFHWHLYGMFLRFQQRRLAKVAGLSWRSTFENASKRNHNTKAHRLTICASFTHPPLVCSMVTSHSGSLTLSTSLRQQSNSAMRPRWFVGKWCQSFRQVFGIGPSLQSLMTIPSFKICIAWSPFEVALAITLGTVGTRCNMQISSSV